MNFGRNLKRICEDRGTTPTALLKRMGVATSKVAMWNSGSLPKADMLVRLAEELGCSVMDFFMDDEEWESRYDTKEPELDEDETEIIRIFRTLGRRERHEFMNMVYSFEEKAHD